MEILLNTVPSFVHLSLALATAPELCHSFSWQKGWLCLPALRVTEMGKWRKEPQISAISILFLLDLGVLGGNDVVHCIFTDLRGVSHPWTLGPCLVHTPTPHEDAPSGCSNMEVPSLTEEGDPVKDCVLSHLFLSKSISTPSSFAPWGLSSLLPRAREPKGRPGLKAGGFWHLPNKLTPLGSERTCTKEACNGENTKCGADVGRHLEANAHWRPHACFWEEPQPAVGSPALVEGPCGWPIHISEGEPTLTDFLRI